MRGSAWIAAFGMAMVLPLFTGTRATAQSECYMRSSSGGTIDLSRLCGNTGNSSNTRPSSTATPTSVRGNGRVFRAAIKRREGRLPIIDVTFNGRHKFEMIVDTGASGTLITADMARAMRLRPIGVIYVDTASQQGVPMEVTVLNTMEVNGAVARNVRVAVADQGLDIGLLGHDFFGNYDLTIKRDVVEFRLR